MLLESYFVCAHTRLIDPVAMVMGGVLDIS